jgi:hypothetical protein
MPKGRNIMSRLTWAAIATLAALMLLGRPAEAHVRHHGEYQHKAAQKHEATAHEMASEVPQVIQAASNGEHTGQPCHDSGHAGDACCAGAQCCPVTHGALAPAMVAMLLPRAATSLPGPDPAGRGLDAAPGERPPRRLV